MAVAATSRNEADPKGRQGEPAERVLRSTVAQSPYVIALRDLREGWEMRNLWLRLGYMDVRRRYRKTILGPFWATGGKISRIDFEVSGATDVTLK